MENQNIDCHPINRYCTDHVSNIMIDRLQKLAIEERLDSMSMVQMFSFWNEIQAVIIDASAQIKELKLKIKELETKNGI